MRRSMVDDYPAAFLVNGRFHQIINSGARNQEAVAVIERHLTLTRALRLECGFTERRMRSIQSEHRQLIAAIRDGEATGSGSRRELACAFIAR